MWSWWSSSPGAAAVAAALHLVGCGGAPAPTAGSSPSGPPVVVDVPTPADDDGPPPGADEARDDGSHDDGGSAGACSSAYDCTLVKDHCGRLHGAPLSRPVVPEVHPACGRARQARMRPACEAGACVAQQIEDPDWTSCQTAADCMTIQWPCSSPIAIGRIHRAEAEAAAASHARTRSCRTPADTRTPAVECLMSACVARTPR